VRGCGGAEVGAVSRIIHRFWAGLKSSQGSSTARADAFRGTEREEKASARFGRNDKILSFSRDGSLSVVDGKNAGRDAGATDSLKSFVQENKGHDE
jgi:hypothetical protein